MQLSLLELQQAFRHALVSCDSGRMEPWVIAGDPDPSARLGIYRNNSRTNLRNALRADFPVVERLVDSEFFDYAANAYIDVTPSLTGDVGNYGKAFPVFLAGFSAAAPLPYLPDVARLEMAWSEVFLAPEAVAADLSGLGAIPVDAVGGLRFGLHPAIRLLASPYPVLTIWCANQADCAASAASAIVSLDAGGEFVLLRRCGDQVELISLQPGEYLWLMALHSGSCLSDAVEAALAMQPDFDLSACLQKHVTQGTFISFDQGETS